MGLFFSFPFFISRSPSFRLPGVKWYFEFCLNTWPWVARLFSGLDSAGVHSDDLYRPNTYTVIFLELNTYAPGISASSEDWSLAVQDEYDGRQVLHPSENPRTKKSYVKSTALVA